MEYVVVGGVAVAAHGLVRATEVIDLFVRPTEANIERMKAAFRRPWNDPELDELSLGELERHPTVRYGPHGEDFVVDVLTRLGEKWSYENLEAETIQVEGTNVRVATPSSLIAMKRGTLPPRDHADAAALEKRFGRARGS